MSKGLCDRRKEDGDGCRVLPLAIGTNDASSNAATVIMESTSKGIRRRDSTAAADFAVAAVAALDAMVMCRCPPFLAR